MSTGNFLNFNLPYVSNGVPVTAQTQAKQILSKATDLITQGSSGIAITYSANYGQTREIEQTYLAGGWNTQTNGANQADVMHEMESLLGHETQAMQGKLRIVPITTMNAYTKPVQPWTDDLHLGIVITDLDRIERYLNTGWTVLGWQNQKTVNNPQAPYAVGGGVATLPPQVSQKIQQTLIRYATQYQ